MSLAKESRGLVLAPDLQLTPFVTQGMSVPTPIIPWTSISPSVTRGGLSQITSEVRPLLQNSRLFMMPDLTHHFSLKEFPGTSLEPTRWVGSMSVNSIGVCVCADIYWLEHFQGT